MTRAAKVLVLLSVSALAVSYAAFAWLAGGPIGPATAAAAYGTALRIAPTLIITPRNYRDALEARIRAHRSPAEEATLHVAGTLYRVPLPPRTAVLRGREPNVPYYITFASLAEREHYTNQGVAAAGWTLRDRIAGHHFYVRDGVLLGVGQRAFAGRHVIALTLSAGEWQPPR